MKNYIYTLIAILAMVITSCSINEPEINEPIMDTIMEEPEYAIEAIEYENYISDDWGEVGHAIVFNSSDSQPYCLFCLNTNIFETYYEDANKVAWQDKAWLAYDMFKSDPAFVNLFVKYNSFIAPINVIEYNHNINNTSAIYFGCKFNVDTMTPEGKMFIYEITYDSNGKYTGWITHHVDDWF